MAELTEDEITFLRVYVRPVLYDKMSRNSIDMFDTIVAKLQASVTQSAEVLPSK